MAKRPTTRTRTITAREFSLINSAKAKLAEGIAAGTMSQSDDGVVHGIAADGTKVHLGHIFETFQHWVDGKLVTSKVAARSTGWVELGSYLERCPSPEHW